MAPALLQHHGLVEMAMLGCLRSATWMAALKLQAASVRAAPREGHVPVTRPQRCFQHRELRRKLAMVAAGLTGARRQRV